MLLIQKLVNNNYLPMEKNEILPFVATWMDLENIILSKVSQRRTNMISLIHGRIDAFELWCWRRLLRVPWTARRSNQSILKEISPEISLEGMMLTLKLQYFGHLIRRVDSLERTLMLRGIGGRRRRG